MINNKKYDFLVVFGFYIGNLNIYINFSKYTNTKLFYSSDVVINFFFVFFV